MGWVFCQLFSKGVAPSGHISSDETGNEIHCCSMVSFHCMWNLIIEYMFNDRVECFLLEYIMLEGHCDS